MRAMIIVAAFALASCATTTAVKTACVPLKTYTPAEEEALAAAVAALNPADPLIGAMSDYGAMRAADRACLKTPGSQ